MRVKLSDVTKYSKGVQINGDDLITDGKYIYLNGGINPSGRWNSANVKENTVTISEGGNSSGYINYITEPFWCGAHCYYLYNGPKNTKYLYYALKSQQERLLAIRSGACMPNIKKADLGNFEFEFDYDEARQNEIVLCLDKAQHLIESCQSELQALDNLIKARFVEMFGSFDLALQKPEWIPISQIGTVVGGSTPKTGVAKYWDGEYRWISPAELKADSGIIYDSVKKITKAGIDSCSLQELPVGTVILSSRAPIGKVAIAGNTFYCNQGFKNIICNEKVLPRYLYTLLLFNTEYLNSLGRGATFKEISKAIVEKIRIPLPSIDRQQHFDSFVAQVDKSKFAVQKALDKAQLLFDSLMQQYFG